MRELPSALWIVRHGESAGNVARDEAEAARLERISIDAGRDADVPLSARGEDQARAFGRFLRSQPGFDAVFASPYLRARRTAEIAAAEAGLDAEVIVDERLREREFGILDRLTRRGIEQLFPEQAVLRTALGKFYHRPPGGESWCDVILRLRSLNNTLSLHYAGRRVLIVCHSVVVLCLRYLLERMTEQQVLDIDRQSEIANCSLTQYELEGRALSLRRFNFVAPLEHEGAEVTAEPDVAKQPK